MKIQTPTIENYRMIEEVGLGPDGAVWKALDKHTGKAVAIKKLDRKNYDSPKEFMKKVNNHPNINDVKEVIRENSIVYLVYEYMDRSLYQCMLDRTKPFAETEIKDLCFQLFQGLDNYYHSNCLYHGGISSSNVFVSENLITIGDHSHGHGHDTNGVPPALWYQAPEMLLGQPLYSSAVDMWAMGAIMMELFTNQPLLFKGSSAADVMYSICDVLGSPTGTTWLVGLDLANRIGYQFPELFGWQISRLVPRASSEALNLIDSLLSWDPNKRPSAREALQHPFFDSCYVDLPFDSERVEDSYEDSVCLLPDYSYESEIKKVETSLKSFTSDSKRAFDLNDEELICLLRHLYVNLKKNTSMVDSERASDSDEETSFESCTEKSDDSKEDMIDHILPEYHDEMKIKKDSESIVRDRFFGNDWLYAMFKILSKSKIHLLIFLSILVSFANMQ